MNSKIAAISLLALLLLQSIFLFLCYEITRNQYRESFLNQMDTKASSLVKTFYFSDASKIEWEKENQEIQLNGQFYDVISIEVIDKITILKCLSDAREQDLIQSCFSSLGYAGKNEQNKTKLNFLPDFKYIVSEFNFNCCTIYTDNSLPLQILNALLPIYIELISPPPNNYLIS